MARNKKPSGQSKASRNRNGYRKRADVFLIVGEGENTEKYYLESFQKPQEVLIKYLSYRRSNRQLVEKAIAEKENRRYAEAWVVFDFDRNPARGDEQYTELENVIALARENGIEVAYSIDSFEVWLRLHYEVISTRIERAQLYDDLSRRFGIDYKNEGKGRTFAESLRQRLENDEAADLKEAIVRARAIHTNNKDLPFREQASVTTVYRLIERLLQYGAS